MLYEVEYSVETAVSAENIDEAKEKVVKNLNAIVQEGDSAMCVVLYERGYDIDEIGLIVEAVQLKWEEVAQTEGANMCDICVELTGIDIREV